MKISAIDIGSNSVRLATFAGGKTLYKKLETTRLGEGLNFSGEMKAEAIERTAQAVKKFVAEAEADGAEKVYAFATAAVRSAKNKQTFLERVYEFCGITVEVLSGETEAKTGLLGALKGGDGGIIDVGGASTEVNIQIDGKQAYSKSVNMGTVRLFDIAGRDYQKLKTAALKAVEEYGAYSAAGVNMYAIGGTATTLASVKHGLKIYDSSVTDGTRLTASEVEQTAYRLIALSVDEVKKIDGMEPRRADVIGGGALLLAEVMKKFEIREITVSESDNLEGYVIFKEGAL